MAIQIEQKFPRCSRCGKMIHFQASRIEAVRTNGDRVSFCSEICRDEYEELFGLADRGDWKVGSLAGLRGG